MVDGKNYEIKQKSYSLAINGEKTKLKDLMSKKDGIYKVYEVPLGSKKAQYYVNTWVGGAKLAMDGLDCATGQPFTPPKLPKWAYLFMGLHCLNFLNGAVGILLAFLGIMATISISSNTNMPVVARILLDILLVIVSAVVVFALAFAMAAILY